MTDRRLIRRLRDRDEDAFREFVRAHEQPVYNLVLRMLGNTQEAEDVAQDVFVSAFKSIDRFRGESKLGTWLYRIAVNQCYNRLQYLRRRKVDATRSLDTCNEAAVAASSGMIVQRATRPDEALDAKQTVSALERALEALPEDQRVLIVLRDIEHLTYDEIGLITDLVPGTVKSRLHRARAALRASLQQPLPDPRGG